MIRAFLEGFAAPWVGLQWLSEERELLRYAWGPILINIVLTLILLVALVFGVGHLSHLVAYFLPTNWEGKLLGLLLDIVLVMAALGIAVGVMCLLSALLCSFAYTALARQVEKRLGTPEIELRGVSVLADTLDTLAAAAEIGAVSLLVLACPILPFVGPALAPIVAWYFYSFIFGMRYLEFGLSSCGLRRAEIRRFARRHRSHTLGLGSAVFLVSLVPFLGAIVLPAVVIGGTALEHRLRVAEAH
jgi:uncharacterized protein involved in cysteine biosynthesis